MFNSESAIEKFNRAPVEIEPTPHLICEDFLDPSDFEAIRGVLPHIEEMTRYQPPHRFRYYYMMDAAGLEALPQRIRPCWSEVIQLFRGEALIRAAHEKFAAGIRAQWSHREALITRNLDHEAVIETPRLMLTSDCEDFTLHPHTDGSNKVVTLLYYLAGPDEPVDWGTEFYRPKDRSLTSFDSHHYDRNDFDVVRRANFRPNTLVAFVKTDSSFHGVHARRLAGRRRNMIVLNLEIGARPDFDVQTRVPLKYFQPEQNSA